MAGIARSQHLGDALKIVESATQAEPIQVDSEMVTGPTVANLDRPLQGRRDFRGGQPRFEWYAAPIADLSQFGAGSSCTLPRWRSSMTKTR